MPFTPTHVAAIVPVALLARNRLPFSALAIGSMIPDLPLFLPGWLALHYRATHSIPGLFTACLPLGMLMFLWFQRVAKVPLCGLLPSSVRQRLAPYDRPNLEASYSFFMRVCVAILVGSATHIFWDSFTHFGRWGYTLLPRMNRIVFQSGSYSLELYKALQHGSTVIFLPLLFVSAGLWLRRRELSEPMQQLESDKLCQRWLLALIALPNLIALLLCAVSASQFVSVGHFARVAVTNSGFVLFVLVNIYAASVRGLSTWLPAT